ncbi:proline-rich extensin-like protein EPR1 [Daucus carota subsp. sativus]|uniref:proline-rich extensin-like protein EPR1 n=1 Tax=Daucus carota subsp. sativus TaxID=79200 RepID=UPI0007F04503|nr:PREDICTED: proline-rich extensin-like protein EPR1 [Daucus carota subsp. sativus]
MKCNKSPLYVFMKALVPYGESQYEDEKLPVKRTWPLFPFPIPHFQLPHYFTAPKKPVISPDCIKAKLALSDCVKEKLVSAWYSAPLVKDCCHPIANHKKSCPDFIVKIDELLIPHYMMSTCHAPNHSGKHADVPSASPPTGPPPKGPVGPSPKGPVGPSPSPKGPPSKPKGPVGPPSEPKGPVSPPPKSPPSKPKGPVSPPPKGPPSKPKGPVGPPPKPKGPTPPIDSTT